MGFKDGRSLFLAFCLKAGPESTLHDLNMVSGESHQSERDRHQDHRVSGSMTQNGNTTGPLRLCLPFSLLAPYARARLRSRCGLVSWLGSVRNTKSAEAAKERARWSFGPGHDSPHQIACRSQHKNPPCPCTFPPLFVQ